MTDYLLKFPYVWLVSYPLSPSGFGDRAEGIILSVKATAHIVYCYEDDLLVELPLKTRIVKIKPVDVTNHLTALKSCFINNYDIDPGTERQLRVYIADVEAKVASSQTESVAEEDQYSSDHESCSDEVAEEEDDDDNNENNDDYDDESEEEVEDDSESVDSSDDDEASDDVSSSSEDDDEDAIDFKVVIESPSMEPEVRGFCINKRKIINRVTKVLKDDYGSEPVLYYCDADGDQVLIKRYNDIRFVLKSHEKQRSQLHDGKSFPLLRLHCRMGDEDLNIMSTLLLSRKEDGKDVLSRTSTKGESEQYNTTVLNDDKFHWQQGEILGAGSFGQVFGGILSRTGKRIAVKEVLLSGSKGHIQQAKALQVEIKILSTLEHPNIIKYLGAEFTKTKLRIFLEQASEGSLKDILNEFGALSEPLLRKYMVDILKGLNFLHSKGIIHRDIKPSNLLLDKGVVKLADFGCSATVKLSSDTDKSEMQHDTVIGTTVYMSPEIMRASEDEDTANSFDHKDIWSLGITFCEMATAKSPFKNAAAAIYAVCVSKQYPPLPRDLSEDAVTFLARCLNEDASSRADTNELLTHPFCVFQESSSPLKASVSHTLSTVALLPDFDAIEKLECKSQDEGDISNSNDNDSFFDQCNRKINNIKIDHFEEHATGYNSCDSDDDTLLK